MTAYYNELDPVAAQWLRNLIAAGHIAPGHVDERSILEVRPDDLRGYTQCHFFAGIGVWSHALRLAGWSDDRPVWTGSCPCQPFSAAGKGDEFADERHLWPVWFRLIRERRPESVFGEQVASKDALAWLDHVQADLEGAGYAVGPFDLCAAGFGAPHIRQRLFFVADAAVRDGRPGERGEETGTRPDGERGRGSSGGGAGSELADADGGLAGNGNLQPRGQHGQQPANGAVGGWWSNAEWIACRDGKARPVEPGTFPLAHGAPARLVGLRAYGNAIVAPVAEEFIRAYLDVTNSVHRQGTV